MSAREPRGGSTRRPKRTPSNRARFDDVRRGDDVIRGHGVRRVGKLDGHDGAPGACKLVDRGAYAGGDVFFEAFREVFLRHADANAARTPIARRLVIAHWIGEARGVLGIVTGDHLEHPGRAANIGGEGSDLIEARRECDEPVARDAPVGRLHADHVGKRGRLTNGAAGIGAEGSGRHRCRHGDRAAAR
jgi:hypothetical protein